MASGTGSITAGAVVGRRAAADRDLPGSRQQAEAHSGDEPTGNLDPKTSELVFHELIGLFKSEGVAALIATHNLDLAARMDRVLRMENGQLVEVAPGGVH